MATNLSLMAPPQLRGYVYPAEEAFEARDQRRLLTLELETNFRQQGDEGNTGAPEADLNFLKEIIQQAKTLGAQAIVLGAVGEPTQYSKFHGLIQYIAARDLIPVVKSNLVGMDDDLAAFLFRRQVSVLVKMDLLQTDYQELFAGGVGALNGLENKLKVLIRAGFTNGNRKHPSRLGGALILQRGTLQAMTTCWHYLRRHNIWPHWELPHPCAEPIGDSIPALTGVEIQQILMPLVTIDRDMYGFDWGLSGGCLKHYYNLYVTLTGDVRPCKLTTFDQHPALYGTHGYPHNLHHQTLREIYDSDLFTYVRNIDAFLKGSCGRCGYANHCIGCRGEAYLAGVQTGLAPIEALSQESPFCLRFFLPRKTPVVSHAWKGSAAPDHVHIAL